VVSANGWAEQIAATLRARLGGPVEEPVWPAVLRELGVELEGAAAVDACGVARRNNLSARMVASLLLRAEERWGDSWLRLLPGPEERHSTLAGRFPGLEGRLRAKTGSLSRTRSLAGYIITGGEPEAIFAILVNNSPVNPDEAINTFVGAMVRALDEYAGRQGMTVAVQLSP